MSNFLLASEFDGPKRITLQTDTFKILETKFDKVGIQDTLGIASFDVTDMFCDSNFQSSSGLSNVQLPAILTTDGINEVRRCRTQFMAD